MELRRVSDLPAYVFDLVDNWKAEAAAQGQDIIDFGIGSHDRGTPAPVVDRLVTEAHDPRGHGYPTSAGLPQLRAELARWYERRYSVVLDPATQTLVTWGASEALTHLPWVLLGPGDTAVVPGPCYPIHRYAVLFSGATPVPVAMWDEHDEQNAAAGAQPPAVIATAPAVTLGEAPADAALWRRIVTACEATRPHPRVILLSFPHNPTTRCVGPSLFAELVAYAKRTDTVLVHDFAYADIAFDGYEPPSILQTPGATDVAVEIVSLSKSHNMAGWRLGFVAGAAHVVAGLQRLKSYLDYGVTTPVQLMGLTALRECPQVPSQMATVYQARRDMLCAGLHSMGWEVTPPRGTMFVWAPLPQGSRQAGSLAFARWLLDEAGVAVSPGVGFGPEGEGFVRFALVQPEDRIERALQRMGRALAEDR